MIPGFSDVICRHVFEGLHALHVHITRPGDQIFLIGILPGELITDQMTAVVQVIAIDAVVFDCMPSGRSDLTDLTALLRRHEILPYTGFRDGTSSQRIKISVLLIGDIRQIIPGKIRHVPVDLSIRAATVSRDS